MTAPTSSGQTPAIFPVPQQITVRGMPRRFRCIETCWSGDSHATPGDAVLATVRERLESLLPTPAGKQAPAPDLLRVVLNPGNDGRFPDLTADDRLMLRAHPQGYVISVDPGAPVLRLTGGSPTGLLYAVVTLGRLLQQEDAQWSLPDVCVRDCPDLRLRGLDWLLNAEANRWAYDWGDGAEATVNRIRRRLEFCLDTKINLVQFDGFGWRWGENTAHDKMLRDLNAFARSRGIHLLFGGYGGGYGAVYQTQFAQQGALGGRVFRNRHSYPDGDVYSCQGAAFYPDTDPRREASRLLGTCLANRELRRLQLADLRAFVQAVEPGALYIHDLDAGDWSATQKAWQLRCSSCRERWSSDRLDAEDGQAGAYAERFRAIRDELDGVTGASGYRGSDCLLFFVGPLYTEVTDSEDTWAAQREYFRTLSALIQPTDTILFGIREQVCRVGERARAADLAEAVAPQGHGISVSCFGGADLYHDDRLFIPLAGLTHLFRGAAAVNLSNGHVHQDALQVVNANYLWNHDAPGHVIPSRLGLSELECFRAIRDEALTVPEIGGPGGVLDAVCADLFGPGAGPELAAVNRTGASLPFPPSTVLWFPVTRRLWRGETLLDPALREEWRMRLETTSVAAAHTEEALRQPGVKQEEDLQWLLTCLSVNARFFEFRVAGCDALASGAEPVPSSLSDKLDDIESLCRRASAREYADPLGGDVATWLPAVELLRRQLTDTGTK